MCACKLESVKLTSFLVEVLRLDSSCFLRIDSIVTDHNCGGLEDCAGTRMPNIRMFFLTKYIFYGNILHCRLLLRLCLPYQSMLF